MKTTLDCIPCVIRQALDAARLATPDPAVHEQVLRAALQEAAAREIGRLTPPALSRNIHRAMRELTGVNDPYCEIKERFNCMALDLLPGLRREVAADHDPLHRALRLAIAGNVIDLGVTSDITEASARQAIASALDEPFAGSVEEFRAAVAGARRILYLTDNAGEIVFDRLLIEQLPRERVVVGVRGAPALNDATRADAAAAGLCDLVKVIDNGSDAPGTILDECSPEFRRQFAAADLIIAKGQGNYETLSGQDGTIYYLFKTKCPVIADHVGLPLGTHVAVRPGAGAEV